MSNATNNARPVIANPFRLFDLKDLNGALIGKEGRDRVFAEYVELFGDGKNMAEHIPAGMSYRDLVVGTDALAFGSAVKVLTVLYAHGVKQHESGMVNDEAFKDYLRVRRGVYKVAYWPKPEPAPAPRPVADQVRGPAPKAATAPAPSAESAASPAQDNAPASDSAAA